jgi:cobalamin biosynthesis protein CobD/CbiB
VQAIGRDAVDATVDRPELVSGAWARSGGVVVEAAFAGALGLQLGGPNRYGEVEEHRAELGDGAPPEAADIDRAIALSRDCTLALAGTLAAAGLANGLRRRGGSR